MSDFDSFAKRFDNLVSSYEQPVEERGLAGDVGSAAMRGIGGALSQIGGGLQASEYSETNQSPVSRFGQWVERKGGDIIRKYRPDSGDGDSWLKKQVLSGVESVPGSLTPWVVGALGSAVAGPEVGIPLGIATLGEQFGGGTWKQRMDQLTVHAPDMPYLQKNELSWMDAGIETGGELASDLIASYTGGLLGQGTKGLEGGIKSLLRSSPKELLTRVAGGYAAEEGTEAGQAYYQSMIDQFAGTGESLTFTESIKQTAIPTGIVFLAIGGGAGGINAYHKKQIINALTNEKAKDTDRIGAYQFVADRIKDPELKDAWAEYAGRKIVNGQPIDLNFTGKSDPTEVTDNLKATAEKLRTETDENGFQTVDQVIKADELDNVADTIQATHEPYTMPDIEDDTQYRRPESKGPVFDLATSQLQSDIIGSMVDAQQQEDIKAQRRRPKSLPVGQGFEMVSPEESQASLYDQYRPELPEVNVEQAQEAQQTGFEETPQEKSSQEGAKVNADQTRTDVGEPGQENMAGQIPVSKTNLPTSKQDNETEANPRDRVENIKGLDLRYDGKQEGFGPVPAGHQITILSGPAEGTTISVPDLSESTIREEVAKKEAQYQKKAAASTPAGTSSAGGVVSSENKVGDVWAVYSKPNSYRIITTPPNEFPKTERGERSTLLGKNVDKDEFNRATTLGGIERHATVRLSIEELKRRFNEVAQYKQEKKTYKSDSPSVKTITTPGHQGAALITRKDGSPYKTERSLRIQSKRRGFTDIGVKKVNGGFIGIKKTTPAVSTQGAESETTKQKPVPKEKAESNDIKVGRADYEDRKAERINKLEARAEKAKAEQDRRRAASDKDAERFYMGQPILVGHHSEKSARAAQKRADNNMRKSLELGKKAEELSYRAFAASSNKAISSDDPQALVKLKEKLAKKQELQEKMKRVNAAWRKYQKNRESLDKAKLTDEEKKVVKNFKPEYSWQKGPFEQYQLSNNNANIRRIKKRIESLIRVATTEEQKPYNFDGGVIIDNKDENRIQIDFDSKPSAETRKILKKNGFKWARSAGVWQKLRNVGVFDQAVSLLGNKENNKFSRTTTPTGTTVSEAQQEAKSFLGRKVYKRWTEDGTLKIVQSTEGITGVEIKSKDGKVSGYYDPSTGQITLIADNIKKGGVAGVLLHEAAHKLLHSDPRFQKDRAKILDSIAKDTSRAVMAARARAIEAEGKDADPDLIAEETLTYLMESKAGQKTSIIRRVIAAVRRALRRIGLPVGKYSHDELVQMFKAGIKRNALGRSKVNEFAHPLAVSFSKAKKSILDNPKFRAWFGDSIVTNNSKVGGEPLVLFHGSYADIKDISDNGFFATVSPELASLYSLRRTTTARRTKAAPQVLPIYFNIRNPLKLDVYGPRLPVMDRAKEYHETKNSNTYWLKNALLSVANKKKIIDVAFKQQLLPEWEKENANIRKVADALLRRSGAYRIGSKHTPSEFIGFGKEGINKTLRKFLQGIGVDGIILVDDIKSNYGVPIASAKTFVVFSPAQIKSIYNTGEFSPTNPDIRYSIASDIKEKVVHPISENESFNKFMHYIVDKNRSIEQIQKRLGGVKEELDLFMKETQRPKISAYLTEKFWSEHVQPFIEEAARNKIEISKVEELAHALHAPEANEALRNAKAKSYIDDILHSDIDKKLRNKLEDAVFEAEKDPDNLPKGYRLALEKFLKQHGGEAEKIRDSWERFIEKPSGITDQEAADIIEKYKGNKEIHALVDRISAINEEKLDILHDAGLITDDEYKAYKNKYKHYVPLYREGFEGEASSGIGAGLQAPGKPIKARGGSSRGVVDIFANTVKNYETALIRAEKAKSMEAFYKLVKNNPDPELWHIREEKKAPYYDSWGNLREYPTQQLNKNEIRIKVNGKPYIIEVNRDDPTAMRMLETLRADAPSHGPIVNFLAKINRFLAAVNTSYAPEFILSNFIRDLPTGLINISEHNLSSYEMFKKIKQSMKTIAKVEMGKKVSKEEYDLYKRYKKAGGKISWMDVHETAQDLAKKIQAEYEYASGKRPVRSTVRKWNDLWQHLNTAVENSGRFAAFKLGVENGMSDAKAAQMAADLTVDFTKKGTMSPVLNSMYLFFNASVHGNYRILRALINSPKARKMVGGLAMMGFMAGMWNAAAGGDDLEDYLKERNLVIKIPGSKKMIKIPLPYGFNFFVNAGYEMADMVTNKDYSPVKGAARLANVLAGSFNPIQAGTLLQTLAPTVLDPFVQVGENKTWFGGELMPAQDKYAKVKKPDSQRYWKSVSAPSKWLASMMNEITGGNKVRSGLVDVSPETLDLVMDTMGGSAFRFVKDVSLMPGRALNNELPMYKIPFVRRVMSEVPEYATSKKYYRLREDLFTREAESKVYPNKFRLDAKEKRLLRIMKRTERKISKLRKKLRAVSDKKRKDILKGRIDALQKVVVRMAG